MFGMREKTRDTVTLTVEEARDAVIRRCRRLGAERVSALDSLGRVLATDVVSDSDVSPFDNSAMDGYAVRAADVGSARPDSPVSLEIATDIPAGDARTVSVGCGQAARIMTGAPLPTGADAVVMVEATRPAPVGDEGIARVEVLRSVVEGENVRRRGEEVGAGDVVLPAGDRIGAAAVGLLAATGNAFVEVHRRPVVAVVVTGSELIDVSQPSRPGAIRDSNGYSIAAQVVEAGGIPVRFPVVCDDPEQLRIVLQEAAKAADFVVTSGGACVGDHDYVKPVLREIGTLEFSRVNMRPGSSQTFGSIDGVPFFGLPGNPSATFVGFEVFIRPALRLMQGHRFLSRPRCRARLSHDIAKKAGPRLYLRARLDAHETGGYVVGLSGSQSSALLGAAHRGNCLLVRPEDSGPLTSGDLVEVIRLDMDEESPCASSRAPQCGEGGQS